MALIPAGYTLAILKDGTVLDTVDLEGYDPSSGFAAASIVEEILGAVFDKASSASRQHYIETGSYLLKGEVESDG